jgi:hypothetical protein
MKGFFTILPILLQHDHLLAAAVGSTIQFVKIHAGAQIPAIGIFPVPNHAVFSG